MIRRGVEIVPSSVRVRGLSEDSRVRFVEGLRVVDRMREFWYEDETGGEVRPAEITQWLDIPPDVVAIRARLDELKATLDQIDSESAQSERYAIIEVILDLQIELRKVAAKYGY